MTNSTFRSLGPIYAEGIGLSITAIATFMSVGIIGGVVLQYPLGLYSDRLDRRLIILFATFGSLLAGLYLAFFAGSDEWLNFIGIFVFGAFAMPLYSLCSAHANDHAAEGQHALVSAGMLFFWSCGAIVGPLFASFMLDIFGPQALFIYTAAVLAAFMLYTLQRMTARGAVPAGARADALPQPVAHLLLLQQARGGARGKEGRCNAAARAVAFQLLKDAIKFKNRVRSINCRNLPHANHQPPHAPEGIGRTAASLLARRRPRRPKPCRPVAAPAQGAIHRRKARLRRRHAEGDDLRDGRRCRDRHAAGDPDEERRTLCRPAAERA